MEIKPSQSDEPLESRDGCLSIDQGRRMIEIKNGPQDKQSMVSRLTPKEMGLLLLMMQRPGRIFSKQMLLEIVWGYAKGIKTRTVDRHIENLRMKLRPQQYRIETHYGLGYSFADNLTPKNAPA